MRPDSAHRTGRDLFSSTFAYIDHINKYTHFYHNIFKDQPNGRSSVHVGRELVLTREAKKNLFRRIALFRLCPRFPRNLSISEDEESAASPSIQLSSTELHGATGRLLLSPFSLHLFFSLFAVFTHLVHFAHSLIRI